MGADLKVGWATVIALALLALTMFFTAVGHTRQLSLAERLVSVQPSLQSKSDEPVEPSELAAAITAVPKINREWAALLLTIAHHESALSARIAANDCKPKECDGGRAFGLYQAHKNKLNADIWGSNDIRIQTLEAARALRSAFYQCNGRQQLRPDWVARTINGYAGRRCDAAWPGLEKRLVTFNRVVRKL